MTEPIESERDTLLIRSLMDLVPNSEWIQPLRELLQRVDAGPNMDAMLEGYGTLLCVLQAAWEMDDQGTLYDRLSLGYFELTNVLTEEQLNEEYKAPDSDDDKD